MRVVLLLLILCVWPQGAVASPFDGQPDAPAVGGAVGASPALAIFSKLQRDAIHELTEATVSVKRNAFGPPLAVAFLLAFLYGCIHAAGPGHGKTLVVGYFVSRNAKLVHGVWISAWSAFTHVASAIAIVAIVSFVLGGAVPSVEDQLDIRLASYAAVAAVGLVLLIRAVRGTAHAHHECEAGQPEHPRHQSLALLGVLAGIIPCTGSLLVLTYTIANGLYVAGVLLVASIGIGMAMTMTAIGVMSVSTRRTLLQWSASRSGAPVALTRTLAVAGPTVIIMIAFSLFVLTLQMR